jgi:protein-L-isoaspartate(D-aspartate) O-methyltransferase
MEVLKSAEVIDPYANACERMIEDQLRARGIVMHRVLEAMRAVPRHLFVSHELQDKAYADEALPSREGQTISQPYMVAVMTQDLDVRPGHLVLELGTGTGYQTAVLSHLVGDSGKICTIERVESLGAFARGRLDAMGITNVRYLVGDGSAGWPSQFWDEPGEVLFDRILVTAGAPEVPAPLVEQLKPGGVMVVPVGDGESQVLRRIVKRHDQSIEETESLGCRFVPLVGRYAWQSPAKTP